MRSPLLELLPNRVRRNYAGGLYLDRWEHRAEPRDGGQPEDWLASTTAAINRGMPDVEAEGLGRTPGEDGRPRVLAELFREEGEYYLGSRHLERLGPDLGFLAKLLDSSMRLHTQAHPTREFARERLGSPWGKLECYVILAVRPEFPGTIRLGFQHPPTRDEWREIISTQDVARMDACFDAIPVHPGEVWWVPGGMVHALGAGLLLLEVMEPSDLVVRCEFEREGIVVPQDARFMGRDLEFCLDVFDYTGRSVEDVKSLCRVAPEELGRSESHVEERLLAWARTQCFEVRRLSVRAEYSWPPVGSARLVVVASGTGRAVSGGRTDPLAAGSRFFIAAGADAVVLTPDAEQTLELCVCQPEG